MLNCCCVLVVCVSLKIGVVVGLLVCIVCLIVVLVVWIEVELSFSCEVLCLVGFM